MYVEQQSGRFEVWMFFLFFLHYCWTWVSLWQADKRCPTAAWTSEWSEFWRAAARRKCLFHSNGNQAGTIQRGLQQRRTPQLSGIMILPPRVNFTHCMWKTKLEPSFKKRLSLQSYILIDHIFYLSLEVKKQCSFFKTNLLHCLWMFCWCGTKPDVFSPTGEPITVMSSITGPRLVTCLLNGHRWCSWQGGGGSTTGSLVSKTPQRLVELKVLTRYRSDLRCVATRQPPGLSHIA